MTQSPNNGITVCIATQNNQFISNFINTKLPAFRDFVDGVSPAFTANEFHTIQQQIQPAIFRNNRELQGWRTSNTHEHTGFYLAYFSLSITYIRISLRFNGHSSGEPGLAGVY